MKKWIFKILFVIVIGFLLYNSVYFETLSEKKATVTEEVFDAASFAKDIMDNKIDEPQAITIVDFLNAAEGNFDILMESEGKRLGVSNERYFMLEGEGAILEIEEDDIILQIEDKATTKIKIATGFIYGNTLRDASGLVSISDYANTMDFNNISIEMNKQVRDKILPPFIEKMKVGSHVKFKGALKIHITNFDGNLRIIPVRLTLEDQDEQS